MRAKGEAVFAATVIRDGQLTVRAIRVGTSTTAGQIARLVESAPIGDTRMQNHAEKLADRLVTPTLGLAVGTAALTGDFNRFLSLVIVDYGTGIRVAAPTAVLASMTHAARAGIIIKSGAHMERLAEVDTVIFDKTGTLTHGSPAVLDVISYERGITERHLLGLAAAAETQLKHPVAEALRVKAREMGANVPYCEETKYRIGLGVEGQVNGYYLHVGNERFMRQSDINVRAAEADRAALDEPGSFLHLRRGRWNACRAGAVYRSNPARKPRDHPAAARDGNPQQRHADRRQCGRRPGGRPAAWACRGNSPTCCRRTRPRSSSNTSAREMSWRWSATASTIRRL